MKKQDGGPAFPVVLPGFMGKDGPIDAESEDGMSKRDYFAAQWLVGASQYWANTTPEKLAKEAYAIADAMLAARGSEQD